MTTSHNVVGGYWEGLKVRASLRKTNRSQRSHPRACNASFHDQDVGFLSRQHHPNVENKRLALDVQILDARKRRTRDAEPPPCETLVFGVILGDCNTPSVQFLEFTPPVGELNLVSIQ
jgi:hypothetical protein